MGSVSTSVLAHGKGYRSSIGLCHLTPENLCAIVPQRRSMGRSRHDREYHHGEQIHRLRIPLHCVLPTGNPLRTLLPECLAALPQELAEPGDLALWGGKRGPVPAGTDVSMWACVLRPGKKEAGAAMKEIRQSFSIAGYNFRLWRGNPRILVTFLLAFILCFLLSDKAVTFAVEHNTTMQLVEVFIWNFGDSNSILLSSVLLVLLFADMPFLSSGTPLYLVRTKRRTWITGQVIYILAATFVYLLFVLICTVFFSMRQSFTANMWSPTAAILGYTNAGKRVAIPALVKTLEMSWPYQSMVSIFFLMLGYTSVMVMLMLLCNLRFGQAAGVVSVLVYSVYGILMQPDTIQLILKLPDEAYYIANVIIGWVSPLNQATYHMHNFGYDKLPRLWQSYLIFFALVAVLYIAAIRAAKRYQFTFTGTEG